MVSKMSNAMILEGFFFEKDFVALKGLNAQKNVQRCKDFCACASSIQ